MDESPNVADDEKICEEYAQSILSLIDAKHNVSQRIAIKYGKFLDWSRFFRSFRIATVEDHSIFIEKELFEAVIDLIFDYSNTNPTYRFGDAEVF